jgi:hypothetical protein
MPLHTIDTPSFEAEDADSGEEENGGGLSALTTRRHF